MNFRLTDDQAALRTSAHDLLARECSTELARARYDDADALPDRLLGALTEQGWPGLLVPERHGGHGLGVVELCLVLEEAGRALVPGPLWSTAGLYVPLVLACAGPDELDALLAPALSGGTGTAAVAEADGRWTTAPTATRATVDGSTWRVSGEKRLVPEARAAATILVTAATSDGPGVFAVDRADVECRWVETLDRTRGVYDVVFDGAPATRLTNGTPDAVGSALDVATTALSAELIGTAHWLLDAAVAYAKIREQFDVPIGSFQAVQHKCADDLVDIERAEASVYWAAMCHDADRDVAGGDRPRATAIAKASTGDAARHAARDAIQIHGGIGYTWEHDLHLYIRRVYAAEAMLGGAEEQRSRLADLLAL